MFLWGMWYQVRSSVCKFLFWMQTCVLKCVLNINAFVKKHNFRVDIHIYVLHRKQIVKYSYLYINWFMNSLLTFHESSTPLLSGRRSRTVGTAWCKAGENALDKEFFFFMLASVGVFVWSATCQYFSLISLCLIIA